MNFDTIVITLFYSFTIAVIIVGTWLSRARASSPVSQVARGAMYITVGLIAWELCSLLALRVTTGAWLYTESPNPNGWLFEESPHLVALPKPRTSYKIKNRNITHNSLGFRGDEFPPKSAKKRIIAIGGSTTYSVQVSDNETWPRHLQDTLGNDYEVLNVGVPGHSTAEHLYMVGVVASRLQPDIVILHIGLNDMHCMHDPHNSPIENRCHTDLLSNYMGLCYLNKVPRLAGLRTSLTILQNLTLIPRCPPQAPLDGTHKEIDTDVAESFKRQTLALVSMIKGMGAKPLLVPQVGFDTSRISKNELAPWVPHLDKSQLPELMQSFNALLKDVASTTGSDYVTEVDQFSWRDDLFIDPSHLGSDGNKILATMISSHVRSQ